jgi:SAM-dependent methyltransferase
MTASSPIALLRLRWPLPALLAWAAAWLATSALGRSGALPPAGAMAAGMLVGALPALAGRAGLGFWRRVIVAGGFPASLAAAGLGAALPAWAWLLPLALLLAAYPIGAWRDAPVFPTPRDALSGIGAHIALAPGASVLDAGCGLGHGLRALRATWPHARVAGIERSGALALAARLLCPWARIARGDMWSASWAAYDLVYLFQRPESMAPALAKAEGEMRPGTWLVSLEFAVPGRAPDAVLHGPGGRPALLYRLAAPGDQRPAQSGDGALSSAFPRCNKPQGPGHSGR